MASFGEFNGAVIGVDQSETRPLPPDCVPSFMNRGRDSAGTSGMLLFFWHLHKMQIAMSQGSRRTMFLSDTGMTDELRDDDDMIPPA